MIKRQKHNRNHTREYRAWADAKSRCNSKLHRNIECYVKRGIKMCDYWANSFMAFYEDMGDCPIGYTLERIRVNEGYCKCNCKWATWEDQYKNKQNTIFIEHQEQVKTIMEWIKIYKLNQRTVYWRYHKGVKPPELFSSEIVFCIEVALLLDLNTGIFYNGYKEAYKSRNFDYSYGRFCIVIKTNFPNRTNIIKI